MMKKKLGIFVPLPGFYNFLYFFFTNCEFVLFPEAYPNIIHIPLTHGIEFLIIVLEMRPIVANVVNPNVITHLHNLTILYYYTNICGK